MNQHNTIPDKIKSIYLMAICGTGMGSLAGLLKQRGYQVSGSDNNVYPPMSTELKDQGIEIFSPYAAENLQRASPDLVIVGNAIAKTNPEAEYLLNASIPYCSMPEALKHFFLADKDVIVVSGTHGKTTTSSLMAFLLQEMGLDPSFMIGGVVKDFARNFKIGSSKFFVVEGDEYDTAFFDKGPKFLHYNPKHVIMTSLEFDHADIYNNLDQISENFIRLAKIIPASGSLHWCEESVELKRAVVQCPAKNIIKYGCTPGPWQVAAFQATREGASFDILTTGKPLVHVQSPLSGLYNALNVAACFSVLHSLGLDLEQAALALKRFKGVKRRQEILYQDKNITIIDDFAHHPTAVQKTIVAVREMFPQHHLVAVFEPRSNTSRRAVFQKEYCESFHGADEVIISPVNQPEKVPDGKILDVPAIIAHLNQRGTRAHAPKDTAEIINIVQGIPERPMTVLIMSNGGFDGLHQRLVDGCKR